MHIKTKIIKILLSLSVYSASYYLLFDVIYVFQPLVQVRQYSKTHLQRKLIDWKLKISFTKRSNVLNKFFCLFMQSAEWVTTYRYLISNINKEQLLSRLHLYEKKLFFNWLKTFGWNSFLSNHLNQSAYGILTKHLPSIDAS